MAKTENELKAALCAVGGAAQDYVFENSTGSGMLGVYPPLKADHPLYNAICHLERLLADKRLPPEIFHTWVELVDQSRTPGERYEPGYLACRLANWAEDMAKLCE